MTSTGLKVRWANAVEAPKWRKFIKTSKREMFKNPCYSVYPRAEDICNASRLLIIVSILEGLSDSEKRETSRNGGNATKVLICIKATNLKYCQKVLKHRRL